MNKKLYQEPEISTTHLPQIDVLSISTPTESDPFGFSEDVNPWEK